MSRSYTLRRRGTWIFGVLVLLFVLGLAVYVLVVGLPPAVSYDPFLDRAMVAIGLTPCTWLIWRFGAHPGVDVRDSGICVRNPLVTYVIPWEAVASVHAEDEGGLTIRAVDRSISAFAFIPSPLEGWLGRDGARESATAIAHEVEKRGKYSPLSQSFKRLDLGLVQTAAGLIVWVIACYIAANL